MSKIPAISVIMSVYNGEKHLAEAVDSILNQTFEDFEFIIIEDASTDQTPEILKNYGKQDHRIKIITKEENRGNKGFIENLNIGLRAAQGKYIARMDADDISAPERFEKQVEFLENNEDVFMVGSDIQHINEDGKKLRLMKSYLSNENIRTEMIKNISMFHPVILFRNNHKTCYREKMLYCEDYDLYFRLMGEDYKFANITEPLLQYRILENSISRKDQKIIRWLFVEKARTFYLERKETGSDSYDKFEPHHFLNILNFDYHSNIQDLLYAAKTSLKYQNYEDLRKILNKAEKYYPDNSRFTMFRLALKTPKFILPYLLKLTMK